MNPDQQLTTATIKTQVLKFLGKKHEYFYYEGMTIPDARDAIQKYNDYYENLILTTLGPNNAHLYRKDMKLDEAVVLKCLRRYTHFYVAGMTVYEACDSASNAHCRERLEEHFAERDAQAELDAKDV